MAIHRLADPAAAAPLFIGREDGLLRSVLDGCMGEAYGNDARTAARVVAGDLVFLAGDAFCGDAAALAMPETVRPGATNIVPEDESWSAVVERVWGDGAVRGERYAFRKDMNRFSPEQLACFRDSLPDGLRLAPIDGPLYRRALTAEWSRDFVSLFRDEADYLARGVGVMALEGDEPLAGASSYAVYRGGVEIEIDTRADCRRRGLATACGAALMLECFRRRLYPDWDAANRISARLAEKLGYVTDRPYPVYEIRSPAR